MRTVSVAVEGMDSTSEQSSNTDAKKHGRGAADVDDEVTSPLYFKTKPDVNHGDPTFQIQGSTGPTDDTQSAMFANESSYDNDLVIEGLDVSRECDEASSKPGRARAPSPQPSE
jgi:hypothetical protein